MKFSIIMDELQKDETRTECNPDEYISVLKGYFRPAQDEKDVTHYLTTSEVYEAIRRLDPASGIRTDDVYKAMLTAGFRYGCRPGTVGIDKVTNY